MADALSATGADPGGCSSTASRSDAKILATTSGLLPRVIEVAAEISDVHTVVLTDAGPVPTG